ncbi:hypothetical protein D5F74_01575 [Oenococcus oeni]|nr:hypothetical protein D5F74_01575 [Oenococcus oeni]
MLRRHFLCALRHKSIIQKLLVFVCQEFLFPNFVIDFKFNHYQIKFKIKKIRYFIKLFLKSKIKKPLLI